MAESSHLLYHLFVRAKVLRYIRKQKLLCAGDRVCVAVSGGADSVALARVLLELRAELGIVLSFAHFNHRLRGEASAADEAFVAELARQHKLEFFSAGGDVRDHALTTKLSLEAAARELRYGWFGLLATQKKLDAIATGHTLDDQAETVLLKFLRGAGTRGLAGIYPEIRTEAPLYHDKASRVPGARIVRPLLQVTRAEVEQYLTAVGQTWREDESNLDHAFTRNRVRHELLPLLEREYNPNLRQVLSDAAELARAEEEYWQALVERELEAGQSSKTEEPQELKPGTLAVTDGTAEAVPLQNTAAFPNNASACLNLDNFAAMPLALQRRLLKRLLESQQIAADFEHVEKLLRCALGESRKADLPGGWIASRTGGSLELLPPQPACSHHGYAYTLPVPGETHIPELGLTLRCVPVPQQFAENASPGSLLSVTLLSQELTVRNWRPGDRFWPVHSKSEEKLKRLFGEQHIPAEQRPSWPVVLDGEQIVWVRAFPVGRAFAWNGTGDAMKIELI